MRWAFPFLVGALLVPLTVMPASGVAWRKSCVVPLTANTPTTSSVNTNTFVCMLPTSAASDADILHVRDCENIDVGLSGDKNGDGTSASALTVTLQWCPVDQTDATVNTDGERDAACVDYASGTLTGDGTLQGAGVPSGLVRLNMGGTFAADPIVWLKCNGARQ